MNTQQSCPDCGTAVGQSHRRNCDVERCSVCGEQRLSCGCEGHDPVVSAWTGEWPAEQQGCSKDGEAYACCNFPVSEEFPNPNNRDFLDEQSPQPEKHFAPETEGLGPLVQEGTVIGYFGDINGPETDLVAFQPTRAELRTLAQHYLERFFRVQDIHAMGMSGSWEIREEAFAERRFLSIAETLNSEEPMKEFQEYIDKRWAEIDEWKRENKSALGHLVD